KQLDQLRPNKNDLNDAKHLAETQFILKRAKSYAQKSINWTIFIQLLRQYLRYDCDYKN
ncbi:IS110 family transposase, partial [Leuconostoc falkenbergense]|nr:IS110 family transposase [Leuconostoc falkenbergense]